LTRKNCQFKILKSFEEPWGIGKNNVFDLQTEGHTRIGPALRHAQMLLNKTNSKRRILVLLTDGKPIDYDRYEGTYGEKDIQMAISEGKSIGVSTFAFAFEKDSNQSFIKMFGRNSFEIVSKPSQIGEKFLDFLTSKE
jgi:nitric oxide reductase NorD protein